ncbi:MAG TPA: histidine kinase dimerization/phospho-acceptor domain-containing protein, partial [Clostridia bacterium]|nr:histidine kinase dimerization/phospho-acceptor domain-containing protein [Clostridia bacterium]
MSINRPGTAGQSLERLSFAKALCDSFVSGIVLVNETGQVTTLTAEARTILGIPDSSQSHVPLESLPPPLGQIVRETIASGRSFGGCPIELHVKPRGNIVVAAKVIPLRSESPSPVVLVLNSLTPARQLEEQIGQLDRLASLGTLSADVAHEIKNALVAIKTFIDLLLEKDQQSELAEVVRREMGRMDSLLIRMLKLASPSQGAFSAVRLHTLLDHSLRLVQPQ